MNGQVLSQPQQGQSNTAIFLAKSIFFMTLFLLLAGVILKLLDKEIGLLLIGLGAMGFLSALAFAFFGFGAQQTEQTVLKTGILMVGVLRSNAQENMSITDSLTKAFQLGADQSHRLLLGSPGAEAKAAFEDGDDELGFPASIGASLGER